MGWIKIMMAAAALSGMGTTTDAAEPPAIDPARLTSLSQELDAAAELFHLPGYAAAVVQDGRIVYRRNSGFADVAAKRPVADDTIFSLASVTKSFTGVMMMQLEQERRISLDDPLLKYPFDLKSYSPEILDPATRLRHVLSMTSGGVPGATFSYNGGRFNLLSGVFNAPGKTSPDAYAAQVTARILAPLQMDESFDGFAAAPTALAPRIVHRYRVTMGLNGPVYTDIPYTVSAAYPAPAAGLFSTISDLARYATALDDNRLISAAQYRKMTTPTLLSGGGTAPYGLGWLTEIWNGQALHWVYGEGSEDGALLLQVPGRGLTFIFLTNSGDPSHAARLQSGEVLRSPFALAFLQALLTDGGPTPDFDGDLGLLRRTIVGHAASGDTLAYETLFTQALARNYLRSAFKLSSTRPEELTRLLYELHPQAFDKPDIPLIVLLSRLDAPDLAPAAQRLVRAFDAAQETRPEALYFIGKYFDKAGRSEEAARYYRRLANEPGFLDEGAKIDACALLGRYYLKRGEADLAREYFWRSLRYARAAGYSQDFLAGLIRELASITSTPVSH